MGTIGVFVPIWPTTVFAIAASILFAKANPRLHAWLLKSRFLGPYLENYHNKIGIAMPYKLRTVWFMWSGMIFSMTFIGLLWVQLLIALIGVAVTIHIFTIKTRIAHQKEKMGFSYNLLTIALSWIFFGAAVFRSFRVETILPLDIQAHMLIVLIAASMSAAVLLYAIIVNRHKAVLG